MKTKIVIIIERGVLTGVFSNRKQVEVELIDYDDDADEEGREDNLLKECPHEIY